MFNVGNVNFCFLNKDKMDGVCCIEDITEFTESFILLSFSTQRLVRPKECGSSLTRYQQHGYTLFIQIHVFYNKSVCSHITKFGYFKYMTF